MHATIHLIKSCIQFSKRVCTFIMKYPTNRQPPWRFGAPGKLPATPRASSNHLLSPQQPLHRESPEISGWNQERKDGKRRKEYQGLYIPPFLSPKLQTLKDRRRTSPSSPEKKGRKWGRKYPKEPLTYSIYRWLVQLRVLDAICPCVLHKMHHILCLTLRNPGAPTYRCWT